MFYFFAFVKLAFTKVVFSESVVYTNCMETFPETDLIFREVPCGSATQQIPTLMS